MKETMTTDTAVSNTSEKYEIVREDRISVAGRTLYRIRALRDIPGVVNKGELGGYLSGPESLTEDGNCWVGHNARVWDGAQVQGNAIMTGSSSACGGAIVKDSAYVDGRAQLIGRVLVANDERIGQSDVFINATMDRASQFVRNGYTVFTFAYVANQTGGTMAIPVGACDDQTAMAMSLMNGGNSLTVFISAEGGAKLAQVNMDTGFALFSDVARQAEAEARHTR